MSPAPLLAILTIALAVLDLGSGAARADGIDSLHFDMGVSLSLDTTASASNSLRIASREGRLQDIERLLESGADINSTSPFGQSALMYAAQWGRVKAARLLIQRGSRINETDYAENTPLILASKFCNHRTIADLLSADANVNLSNQEGRTALIYTAKSGCRQGVELLLQVPGIDLSHKDDDGKTALDYATEDAQLEVGGPSTAIVRMLTGAHGNSLP